MFFIKKLFFTRNGFTNKVVKDNTILLLETNGCHGEVVGGCLQYFKLLGYNIDVLVNNVIFRENPFKRLDSNGFNLYHCNKKEFFDLLTYDNIKDYKHIFVMSSVNYDFGERAVVDLFPELKKHKSLFFVHHNDKYIDKYHKDFDKKRNIMLGRFKDVQYVNPHLFGNVHNYNKNTITTFVSVGGINPKRKNHTILLNAIEKLDSLGLEFRVFVIGAGKLDGIKPNIKKHITLLGHLNYPDMYDYVENSDFFLPLLDPDNSDHERYIKTQVTGSAQLIYGFNKIPIIHSKFADFYGFDRGNSILYDDDLFDGMKLAIEMKQNAYRKKIENIKKLSKGIMNESLNNLQGILNEK